MCERDSSDDVLRGNELSRRQFGSLGLGATLAAMLPTVAAAVEVSESEVEIKRLPLTSRSGARGAAMRKQEKTAAPRPNSVRFMGVRRAAPASGCK